MKIFACLIPCALIAIRISAAQENPAEAEIPAVVPAAPEIGLEVKHKSSFAIEENSRNPFWPIGWKPAAKVANNGGAGPEVRPTAFLVSSITMDQGARFAIINGKVMTEGQVFGLQMGSQTYQVTVKAIQDGQVVLARRDQEIVVPLRRR